MLGDRDNPHFEADFCKWTKNGDKRWLCFGESLKYSKIKITRICYI